MDTTYLSSEQIQAIYDFTRKKYVKYYDVQLEIVDHVASKIEERMMEDDTLTFEMALHEVYKSFGIFGFTKMAQSIHGVHHKMWQKRLRSFVLEYLTLPKLMITLAIVWGFHTIFSFVPSIDIEFLFIQMISFVIVIFCMIGWGLYVKRRGRYKEGKLAVIDGLTLLQIGFIFWAHMPIQMISLVVLSPWFQVVVSCVFAMYSIIAYALLFVFPRYLEQEIEQKYAHLQLDYT